MTDRDTQEGPVTSSIVTEPRYHRCRRFRIARERTTVQGIEISLALLRTVKFQTIEQLSVAMALTVPQVRWRLREAVQRGFITQKFYRSFAE
jgi:hypothetical protein